MTITYQPDEVLDIIQWIWENQDKIGGMAFLPAFDAQYDQMPYVEIDDEEYERLAADFPDDRFLQDLSLRGGRSDHRGAGAGLHGRLVRHLGSGNPARYWGARVTRAPHSIPRQAGQNRGARFSIGNCAYREPTLYAVTN